MTGVTIGDVLLLLKEEWLPKEKKEQIRNMILDTIDMADAVTKKLKEDLK